MYSIARPLPVRAIPCALIDDPPSASPGVGASLPEVPPPRRHPCQCSKKSDEKMNFRETGRLPSLRENGRVLCRRWSESICAEKE